MTAALPSASARPPTLRRRLASFLYEGMLLFGIAFGAALVYGVATRQQHALQGRLGLVLTLFVVIGLYFLWCWTRSGQTLAMQTWRLRLVDATGQPPRVGRAAARYLLAWLWFLPAIGLVAALDWQHDRWRLWGTLAGGVVAYALLALALPGRQFLHDLLAGTRLVDAPPKRR